MGCQGLDSGLLFGKREEAIEQGADIIVAQGVNAGGASMGSWSWNCGFGAEG
jgi:hypothetical protein